MSSLREWRNVLNSSTETHVDRAYYHIEMMAVLEAGEEEAAKWQKAYLDLRVEISRILAKEMGIVLAGEAISALTDKSE